MASWRRVAACVGLVVGLGCSNQGDKGQENPGVQTPAGGGVRIEPAGGLFEGQVSVSLFVTEGTAKERAAEGGLQVRYTTDGSPPTPTSPVYTGPLVLTETTQLRAQAFLGNEPVEAGTGTVFVARAFDTSSDLPLVVIDGYGQGKPDQKSGDEWVTRDAAIVALEPTSGTARLSAKASLIARAGYHVRGQSSATFEKAPYKVEFWDETNDDVDLSFLGMPAESDWALLGPYDDRSLLRNAFAFTLGRQLGLQAPRFAFAEVYINHDGGALEASDYEGIYMVTETIKNSKRRLDLKQLREGDTEASKLSGGYIFKFDWAAASEPLIECSGAPAVQHRFGQCANEGAEEFPPVECGSAGGNIGGGGGFAGGGLGGGGLGGAGGGFSGAGQGAGEDATCWADLEVVDPNPMNVEQKNYLTTYVTELNTALHQAPMGDYSNYIDVASFVDTLILNELLRNGDAYVRSVYFYKERDAKIVAGPLWDFNLTLAGGGATFCNSSPVGWAYEFRRGSNDWFQRLVTDPQFLNLVRARWAALRTSTLSQNNLEALLNALAEPLRNAVEREFERWPVCDVAGGIFTVPEGQTWDEQLQVIRDYLKARAAWLDTQW